MRQRGVIVSFLFSKGLADTGLRQKEQALRFSFDIGWPKGRIALSVLMFRNSLNNRPMNNPSLNLAEYRNGLGRKHQIVRLVWNVVWPCATWFLPRSLGAPWKRFLLRLFGAHIHPTAQIYSTARIYYPANLTMEAYSCLDARVRCYNVDKVVIGAQATVSQGAFLCTASHDFTDPLNKLITAAITIEPQAWVAARAFVGMGVVVGEGAVVGASSVVTKDVEAWTVVAGNPAKFIRKRVIASGNKTAQ